MHDNQTFVIELLTTLRKDRFSLHAWKRFLQTSWLLSCQTAHANPALQRSWQRVTSLIALLALGMLVVNGLFAGWIDTLRLLPGFALCVIWQQSDLFWHLGLNRSIGTGAIDQPASLHTGQLLPHIGAANILTWLRGLAASYLLGRLSGGLMTPSELALIPLLFGIGTDILDGYIARHTATQSKLGQIADAEVDFCLFLALTLILLQNGLLPLWAGIVMLLRFIVPLLAALVSYLVYVQPVRFGSTIWGKCAGFAQCFYFVVLLLIPSSTLTHLFLTPLLYLTICLLIIAPVAQIVTKLRCI